MADATVPTPEAAGSPTPGGPEGPGTPVTSQGAGTAGEGGSDYLRILSGTSQNLIGIVVAAIATLGAQILMTRVLGAAGFGIVTVLTQAAFVISFATRSGMDMAVLRDVAVEAGVSRWDRIRVPVARAATVAALVSLVVAALGWLLAPQIRNLFSIAEHQGRFAVEAATIGLPFLALANVWLSATRGLKIMRYTLYVFWAGQPTIWVLLMVLGWRISDTPWMSVLAYSVSWVWAAVTAGYFWRRESRSWDAAPMKPGDMSRLFRYAGPRAPAALFSQLLFWTDLFVLTRYATGTEVGVYSASLRAAQVLVLFLTSVNLMFAPYVADLHNRGEIDKLDKLFKTLTRWTLVATIPLFLLIAIAPQSVLHIFGSEFAGGRAALMILLLGQFVNISTGSVGFVLIMAGRTGWDLVVYAGALATSLGMAFWLAPRLGMEGAAIANAVTFAASNAARLVLVKRFIGIQPYDRSYLRLIGPALASGAVMVAVHALAFRDGVLDLLATAVVGGIAYVTTYFAIGLTAAERRGVTGLVARVRTR
ncbi:MAG TPA: oligosaccharide flippase family protein [Actinomycetota bacterium]|nr:oligosaccharide flippase family protein [Actinomycetota bacterium]